MTCHRLGEGLTVCTSGGDLGRTVRTCPSERRRRRHLLVDHGWYGMAATCLSCGYKYGSGAGMPTRSKRRRAEAAETARRCWPSALPAPKFREYLRKSLEAEFPTPTPPAREEGGKE